MTGSIDTGVHACSACAGDYEDPERTVSPEPDEEDNGDQTSAEDVRPPAARDEFPAPRK